MLSINQTLPTLFRAAVLTPTLPLKITQYIPCRPVQGKTSVIVRSEGGIFFDRAHPLAHS